MFMMDVFPVVTWVWQLMCLLNYKMQVSLFNGRPTHIVYRQLELWLRQVILQPLEILPITASGVEESNFLRESITSITNLCLIRLI